GSVPRRLRHLPERLPTEPVVRVSAHVAGRCGALYPWQVALEVEQLRSVFFDVLPSPARGRGVGVGAGSRNTPGVCSYGGAPFFHTRESGHSRSPAAVIPVAATSGTVAQAGAHSAATSLGATTSSLLAATPFATSATDRTRRPLSRDHHAGRYRV